MVLKRFRINVYLRVAGIIGCILLLKYGIYEQPEWLITNTVLVILAMGLVYELLRYVERTNQDLANFLLSIKHKDFMQTSSPVVEDVAFPELHHSFNEIRLAYQSLRAEKESHAQYLDTIIEHVQVALICFRPGGDIELMNRAAKRLLDRPFMSNISILERVDPSLLKVVQELTSGESQLVKALINEELLHLAIQSTQFKLRGNAYTLISIQDIRSELDEKEVETWHKLIRVLTHEMMNSITPIVSLTQSIQDMLTESDGTARSFIDISDDIAEDIRMGLSSIEGRGRGLLHFVEVYRNLTRIPIPQFNLVSITSMFQRIERLMYPILEQEHIQLLVDVQPEDLQITADQELVEQVLINLIQNAIEAFKSAPGIPSPLLTLSAMQKEQKRVYLQLEDNAGGIDQEIQDKIFIPFFSTKKQGSGIGLSLSRQIMRLHKGSISFQTTQEEGTIFTLIF